MTTRRGRHHLSQRARASATSLTGSLVCATLLWASLLGCGAAPRPTMAPPTPSGPVEAEDRGSEAVVYERILRSFTARAALYLLLDPRALPRHDREEEDYQLSTRSLLGAARGHFTSVGDRLGAGSAALNLGALAWQAGEANEAYRHFLEAQRDFAQLGYLRGLAHVYEWLGHAMLASGATERAAEQLAVAYQMFGICGDEHARARILGYVGD